MKNRSSRPRDHHRYASGSDNAHWQWSATENPDNSSNVYNVDFTDGDDDWDHKDNNRLSSRPVALAELDASFSILFFYETGNIFVQSSSACKNRLSIRLHMVFLALYPSTCRSIPK